MITNAYATEFFFCTKSSKEERTLVIANYYETGIYETVSFSEVLGRVTFFKPIWLHRRLSMLTLNFLFFSLRHLLFFSVESLAPPFMRLLLFFSSQSSLVQASMPGTAFAPVNHVFLCVYTFFALSMKINKSKPSWGKKSYVSRFFLPGTVFSHFSLSNRFSFIFWSFTFFQTLSDAYVYHQPLAPYSSSDPSITWRARSLPSIQRADEMNVYKSFLSSLESDIRKRLRKRGRKSAKRRRQEWVNECWKDAYVRSPGPGGKDVKGVGKKCVHVDGWGWEKSEGKRFSTNYRYREAPFDLAQSISLGSSVDFSKLSFFTLLFPLLR